MSRSRDLANLAGDATGLETLTVSDITDLTATATELNYSDGVGSAIQTQINALASNSIFVGMIAPFAMSTPPTGWLACDGSAVSKTTYSALFTALGANAWGTDTSDNFYLPDLEGAYLRGTGSHGTHQMATEGGSDHFTGPNVGVFQDDQFQDHRHNFEFRAQGANAQIGTNNVFADSDTAGHSFGNTDNANATAIKIVTDPIASSSYGTPRKGDETRPFSAGVKYCIKY